MGTRWTYITRCCACGVELNRAERVPEEARTRVELSAPLVSLCDVRAHNSLSDVNWRYIGEWRPE